MHVHNHYPCSLALLTSSSRRVEGKISRRKLSLPRRWIRAGFRTTEFTIGFRVEAGYLFLGELEVEATNDDEDTLIDHRTASLGTLRLDGAAFNVAGVISF